MQSIRSNQLTRCLNESYPNACVETLLRENRDAWLREPTSLLQHKALLDILHRQQHSLNTEIEIYVAIRDLDRRDTISRILRRIYSVALADLYPRLTPVHDFVARIHAGGHDEGNLNDIPGRIGRFRRYGYRWRYIIMKCNNWSGVLLLLGQTTA